MAAPSPPLALGLRYAADRVAAFLREIETVEASEFPYREPKEALRRLRESFEAQWRGLHDLQARGHDSPEAVLNATSVTLSSLFSYVPLIGFLLRSTNVRNAFECHGPLHAVVRRLLGPDTRLILSSEWDYSPLTYRGVDYLSDFVLIGFPAEESGNPLLLPLAGHELGHSVWARKRFDEEITPPILTAFATAVTQNWSEYERHFKPTSRDRELDPSTQPAWLPAVAWCRYQAEELFCDLLGLRVFGTGFLHAFAYLLSPGSTGPRSIAYPQLLSRVSVLASDAERVGIGVPAPFVSLFSADLETPPTHLADPGLFLLSLADEVLLHLVPRLQQYASDHLAEGAVQPPDESCARALVDRYLAQAIPAECAPDLATILSAAWLVYHDNSVWSDLPHIRSRRDVVLRELTLKSIEILEIEARLSTPCR